MIVANNDSEGANVEPIQAIQFDPPPEVAIFIPMENGEPLSCCLMTSTKRNVDLGDMNVANLADNNLHNLGLDEMNVANLANNNLHNLGFVELLQLEVDPVLANRLIQSPHLNSGFFKQNPDVSHQT